MSKTIRILKYAIAFVCVLFIGSGCASAKKHKVDFKTKRSACSLEQLVGPDKYYYSDHYQRRIKKSNKRIGGK
jgi:hypothetical protein